MKIRDKGTNFVDIIDLDSDEFAVRLSRGDLPGYQIDITGILAASATATDRCVWELAAAYTPFTAAKALSISSSSAADTSIAVRVMYLDADYALQTAIFTTDASDGKTEKAMGITAWRVLGARIYGATANAGNIYIYDAASAVTAGVPDDLTKVARYINTVCRRDNTCFYTIPAGYEGYIYSSYAELLSTGSASTANDSITFCVRSADVVSGTRYQPIRRYFHGASLGGSTLSSHAHINPIRISEKSDVYISYLSATAASLKATVGIELRVFKTTALDG